MTFRIPMRPAAMTAALLFFAGCGDMPSAPMLDDSSARVNANGAAPQAQTMPIDAPVDPSSGGSGGTVTPPPVIPGSSGSTALVEQGSDLLPALGGSVRNGRWKITVPKNAVAETAHFSVATAATKSATCELGIVPAEMNHFDVPVTLVADCRGVNKKQLATWAIWWWNPDANTWARVPGSVVDTKRKTVSAPLSHFSTYAVGPEEGKSGW
jgi:hypothetical protein